MPDVMLLYFDGCPNWRVADERLAALAEEYGITVEHRKIETDAQAEQAGFRGSPTVLLDGVDPFASADDGPTGLACRMYPTDEGLQGSPTLEQLRTVLGRRARADEGGV